MRPAAPSAASPRRADGAIDHAACAATAAAAGASPTVRALRRWWHGASGWRRPGSRLRAGWQYVRARLRRSALRLRVPPGEVPDCPACRDSCCRAPHRVSLRLEDVARLHDAGLGWGIVPGLGPERAEVYALHPALREVERRPAFRDFPVLRQTDDGACVFLDADSRCSIYPLRPLACRAFPYRLDDDLRSVRANTGCGSWRSDGSDAERTALVDAVYATYDAKARDLAMLRFARPLLRALGLEAYLPGPERSRRFAAALAKSRATPADDEAED